MTRFGPPRRTPGGSILPRPTRPGSLSAAAAGAVAASADGPSLDAWFDVLPLGLAWLDADGALLRANARFVTLTDWVRGPLNTAPAALQAMLGVTPEGLWRRPPDAPRPRSDGLVHEAQGWLTVGDGPPQRLHLKLHAQRPAGSTSATGYLCVVEDRTAEDERDLAQWQLGTLIDTAGVGLASIAAGGPSRVARPGRRGAVGGVSSTGGAGRLAGEVAKVGQAGEGGQQAHAGSGPQGAGPASGLQSIGRDAVLPETLGEFEKVQAAIRQRESVQARYAVRHPGGGVRWLLTRVEPGVLASGEPTTSVVTLDVTEQQEAQERSQRLLHELTTILENSPAGIAYLRGYTFVRCNRRFERMLALPAGTSAGRPMKDALADVPHGVRIAGEIESALAGGEIYETEVGTDLPGGRIWYALSVRRLGAVSPQVEAIAVLTDITRRKNQESELDEMARDRELMFSLSGVGIAFVRDGRIQRGNAALAHLIGRAEAELPGIEWASLYAQAPEADLARLNHAPQRPDQDWSAECLLRRADGSPVWTQVTQRLVEPHNPGAGVILSCLNVDDRHRAEQVVARQAERTRAILDSVFVGIVTVGDRGIEWMNRSARRMFGGDLSDFFNLPISTVATSDPQHPFRQTGYVQDMPEGQAHTFECQVKARDGRVFWVVGNAVATMGNTGRRQITYALLDIEWRRQAEARTAEAQASLQRIIEMAPLAITLRDARTLRVLQINKVAAAVAGLTPEQAVGRTPEELYEPQAAATMRADMQAALDGGQMIQREYRTRGDGIIQTWDARYLPLAAPGQPADQLLLVATDVTHQRAEEKAKLKAAIAQREMLVREVHHRIKNNLQGVAGLLQQIAAKKPEVAPAISEVVGQVQAIAQVYGLQVGSSGLLRLRAVVEAIAQSVQRTFSRVIALTVHGDPEHDWVLPEAESIPIALCTNELLTNAIKHSREGEVSCTMECNDDGVRIQVRNIGLLPDGFSLDQFPGGVSGLGLVRALLPRRSAQLALSQEGLTVLTTIRLSPPGITRQMPGSREEPAGQQITLWPQ